MTRRSKRKAGTLLLALLLCMGAVSGCIRERPVLLPEYTLPTPMPEPTPEPTPEPIPTPEPTPTATPEFDALGRFVSSSLHYTQYVSFEMIQVYEQAEDTFLDAVAVNSYPETLVCAVDVHFFEEAGGVEIAGSQLQTRDGQYVLVLAPGETTVFAQIDTDIVLTDKPLEFMFDEAFGIRPDVTAE